MVKRGGSNITYTSYNLPSVINSGSNSSTIHYGASRNRYKQVAVAGGATETTLYVAELFERITRSDGSLEYRHQIPGGNGIAAIHTRINGIGTTAYVHADHLGSPEVISDAAGAELLGLSFASYGARRNPNTWSGAPPAGDLTKIADTTRIGFTGHEHLDSVGLIHMNGRVYDPLAGRFLSRDPLIDGVSSSQGSNGYAYVHNNPLRFVDPSGYESCEDKERGDESESEEECEEEENDDDSEGPVDDPNAPWDSCDESGNCPQVDVEVSRMCESGMCPELDDVVVRAGFVDSDSIKRWANSLGINFVSAEAGRLFGCSAQAGANSGYAGCGLVIGQSTHLRPKMNVKGNINWTSGVPEGLGGRISVTVPFYSWSMFFNSSGIEVSAGFGLGGTPSGSATIGYRREW